MDASIPTIIGLVLLAFFALLLVGGLILVGVLGVHAYKNYQKQTANDGPDARPRWVAPVLFGALLAFLGALGLTGLATFFLFSTITGAAGIMGSKEPEPVATTAAAPIYVIREPEEKRTKLVAEVRGSLDPALVQKLSDIATRRRELDLRVRSRQSAKGETWIYEFELPPTDLDPDALQLEMRRELEESGLVPVSLSSEKF
ncbi:MAG: hypothetical protein ACI8TQ_003826 [Planctomycetota bacterium]|jgi:hypothetical protein